MNQSSRPVFRDVFAFVDALPVRVRLCLSALLSAPGQPSAILSRQLESSALPETPAARAEIRRVVEAAVTAETIRTLAPHRLDAVIPALTRCDPDVPVRRAPLPVRALLGQHVTEGAPLAGFTVGQIGRWPRVGSRRVAQIIGAAVGAALDARSGNHIGTGDDPMSVARRVPSSTGGSDRWLTALGQALAAGGDERDRGIFENEVLPLGEPVTRTEVAAALEISADRVRRLAARGAERVRDALDHSPTEVDELAAAVSEMLGAAAPCAAVDDALASLGLPPLPDTRSRLLLWRAGPYREVDVYPDWVAVDPAGLVHRTRRLILQDGGVRPIDHVTKELLIEGVVAEHVDRWLARQPVRVGDGLVVATSGRPGDVAERAVHAHGRAMTVDEITEWVAGTPRGFDELRRAPDRRFRLVGGQALALVEWGEDPDPAPA